MSTEDNNDNQLNTSSIVLNDDCCELVFEYLTLEDKCRLERVSEQFKKLVHNSRTYIKLGDLTYQMYYDLICAVNIKVLQCILNKCSNVRRIDCQEDLVNDRVLDVITDCCQRLIEIRFSVRDVTEGAMTRFGEKLGHTLRHIHIYEYYVEDDEEESSLKNQQILFNLCPNITSLTSKYILSVNVIACKRLKRLILYHYHMWSDTDIQAFGRFVDTNDNKLIHLEITTDIDIYNRLDDILRQIRRMTNIKVFAIEEYELQLNNDSIERILNEAKVLRCLVPVCKEFKKLKLLVSTIVDFDLWQTFRHFDALKELTIGFPCSSGSILLDTNTNIKPLPSLKKLYIDCQSIGNYFFSDITQFSPNLEVLNLSLRSPRYQFSNQCLIALSEFKRLKYLEIKFPHYRHNSIKPPEVDEIGLIPLIDNCKQLKRMKFKLRVNYIIDFLIKWIEVMRDLPKRSITFESFFSSKHMETILSNMSRLTNFKCLKVTIKDYWNQLSHCGLIRVMCDKSMTVSVIITAESYSSNTTDVWQTLCRYRDLQRLEFHLRFRDLSDSMSNIEPLMELKEITFECI